MSARRFPKRRSHRLSGVRRALAGAAAFSAATVGGPATLAQDTQPEPLAECEVIARVNTEVILACELDWQVRMLFENRFGREASAAMLASPLYVQAREDLMKSLVLGRVEMALLYADFRSNAPQADLAAIKRQLETPFEETEVPRLMESLKVERREDLEPRLLELGTSIGERREDFYKQMIARSWLTQQIKIDKEVTHEQLLAFYEAHREDYDEPTRVRWEELVIRYDGHPSKSEAYAALALLANEAHAAAAGAPEGEAAFGDLARQRSDGFNAREGGVYDWTTRDALAAEELADALFSLARGEMSPIVAGPVGFHVVRVIERREAGPRPFRDVQAQIRKDLYDDRFGAAVNAKLTELKKSARMWTVFTGDVDYLKLAELQKGPAK